MKNLFAPLLISFLFISTAYSQSQQPRPNTLIQKNTWTAKDLMQPSLLAAAISKGNSPKPLILNIGVVDNIKGAVLVGAASQPESLKKLKNLLGTKARTTPVIIYCGCCPFDKCPNIRPAFNLMKSMGFVNGKLLNLPVNLNQDWITKGYPMAAVKK